MSHRGLVAGVALALVAPVAAQQPQGAEETASRNQKYQVQIFEAVLRQAVQQGGTELATKASQFMPGIVTVTLGDPLVKGVPLQGYGLVFSVQVPDLAQGLLALWPTQPTQPTRPLRPVQSAPPPDARVGADTVVKPDPMSQSPVGGQFSPEEEYRNLVRGALVDAMLDNSGALGLKDDQHLVVTASRPIGPLSSVLNDQANTVIMSIKGADLAAFHAGKISREEVQKRMAVNVF